MLKNYITIALRNLSRNRIYSFINIAGLAIGLSSCILIYLYVHNELNFDRHHSRADRTYRITSRVQLTGQLDHIASSSFMLAPLLKQEYPGIEEAIRLMPIGKQTIWYNEKVFELENIFFTDKGFFNVFDYTFLDGEPSSALAKPKSIVLSEEAALLYFGTTTRVVGKTLRFTRQSYTITGVIREKVKDRSHIQPSALISINSLAKNYEEQLKEDWFYMAQSNYIVFRTAAGRAGFEQKLLQFRNRHITPWLRQYKLQGNISFGLQPLQDIHLDNGLGFDYSIRTNRAYIYIFSVVAVFILLIASINYMNLATARSSKRAREVGIRKVAGAHRMQLVYQFIGESVFTTLVAVVFAVCLTELLLPSFNALTDRSLSLNFGNNLYFLSFLLLLVLSVGIVAGSYPAVFLSRFEAAYVLKGSNQPKSASAFVRKALVVFQFAISIVMIAGTIVVFLQMGFLKNKNMGFSKENVLVVKVPTADSSFVNKLPELKAELSAHPSVIQTAAANEFPGGGMGKILQFVETEDHRIEERIMYTMMVDYDYFDLLGIKMAGGRNFSRDFATDDSTAFIVNETAVKAFGWKNPLGVKMENGLGYKGRIIGVVKDFNFTSLHTSVEPLVIMLKKDVAGYFLMKLRGENPAPAVKFIENRWKQFSRRYPMEYFFLDQNFEKHYRAEEKMLAVFACFSVLTIAIASLGLFGLISYTTEQRTREIGIRKILGASVQQILVLLSLDFVKLLLLAIVFATPVAYYAVQQWLENFAYRIDLSLWPFLGAGLIALAIALFTMSFQSVKTALNNPVESIKYE
jgi:putative ABC transport system permease protein